jgi:hypothetical protein
MWIVKWLVGAATLSTWLVDAPFLTFTEYVTFPPMIAPVLTEGTETSSGILAGLCLLLDKVVNPMSRPYVVLCAAEHWKVAITAPLTYGKALCHSAATPEGHHGREMARPALLTDACRRGLCSVRGEAGIRNRSVMTRRGRLTRSALCC